MTSDREQKVVIRWRTRTQVKALVPTLERVYPVDEGSCFDDALQAIDEAERHVWSDGEPESKTDN